MKLNTYEAPEPEQNPPCIHIPLPLATSVRGFEPGQTVRVVIEGKLEEVSMRDSDEADAFGLASVTSVGVEAYRVGIERANAEVEALMEDD